jgi:transcriptional regulator with XRE-family HTH domain
MDTNPLGLVRQERILWHCNSTRDTHLEQSASEIGRQIKELREKRGLTQAELAAKIGVGVGTVSRWERGERSPMAREYANAMAALGVRHVSEPIGSRGGTSSESLLPTELAHRVERFERRLIRLGATDREADYLMSVLDSDQTSRFLTFGDDGSPRAPNDQVADLESLFSAMEAWVRARIDGREPGLPVRTVTRNAKIEAEDISAPRPSAAKKAGDRPA